MRSDPFDLDRFVMAQAATYDVALAELLGGHKVTHWMWFVFPQLRGLGNSSMAHRYGIASLEEARAYLDHAVLGARLRESVAAVLHAGDSSLHAIFGSPDDMKFHSSMTLFAHASEGREPLFEQALDHFCAGERDQRTLALLAG